MQTSNSSSGYRNAFRLVRDSTAIGGGTVSGSRQSAFGQIDMRGNGNGQHASGFNYLDSPSTTSSTTYKVQMISEISETGYINRSALDIDTNQAYGVRTASTITVMEIKG